MKLIQPGGEPFLFPGSSVGCLLVHGFTGAPREMLDLGVHLAEQGYTVHGVRLFAHGTQVDDMLRARWRDWLASVEDGYHLLHRHCDRIVIMGLSMGGMLSLIFASRFPVSGVVAMSTPYAMPADWRLRFIRFFSLFIRHVAKGESDWVDPTAEEDHFDYPYYPTPSVAELRDLVGVLHTALPLIKVPTLVIHSKNDGSVPPQDAEKIFQALGSEDKILEWVLRSGHVITRDAERQRVFALATEFVSKLTGVGS
jgi:carboxylesterase